jgi:hypothetical protein
MKNPENDPVGVHLECTPPRATLSILYLVSSFPSLDTFSVELVGLATLLYASTALKDVRIDIAGTCAGTGAATTSITSSS